MFSLIINESHYKRIFELTLFGNIIFIKQTLQMSYQQLICSICLAAQENPRKLEKCVHSFCTDCISQWLDIKNSCPLCLNLVGITQYNNLLIKPPQQVQFDTGALVFQTQLKSIDQTMKNLQSRISLKYQESKNLKSHFPKSSLTYVQEQFSAANNYYASLEQSIFINDNINISTYMQLITEILLDIENVLNGGEIGKMHEEDYYEDQYCESCSSDEDYDQELQEYLHCQNARKQKVRQKKTALQTNGQAKSNKIIKA